MRKIFNKMLAGITTVALVATLFVGIGVNTDVKADTVTLTPWSFFASGTAPHAWGDFEDSRFTSVTLSDGTVVNNLATATTDATGAVVGGITNTDVVADGFSAVISSNGWQADYSNQLNNPWSLRVNMDGVELTQGHLYTVSFKAKATSNKYAVVSSGDAYTNTYFSNTITIGTEEKTFKFDIGCYVEDTATSLQFMFGAFPIADDVVTTTEVNWAGTVTISEVQFIDNGADPDWEAPPKPDEPVETTVSTENPTTAKVEPTTKAPTTVAPTTKAPEVKKLGKVKKVKAKNNKKKALTITWKKVKNAKKYQVKVGSKSYNTSKVKIVVKKLKKGKKYTVRVRAKASGYKTGAWSNKVKVKIKK